MLDFSVASKVWDREYNDSEPRMIQTLGCRRQSYGSQRDCVSALKEIIFLSKQHR